MPSTSATRRAGGSHTPPASPPPPAALTRRRGGGQTDGAPLSTPSPSSSSLSSPSFLRTVRRCLAPVRRAKSSVRRTRACLRSGGGDLRALARWLAAACLASDEKFDSEEEFFDLDERHLRVGVNKSRAPTRASLFALDVGAQSASPSVCVRSFSSLSPVSQGRGHRDRRTQRQDPTLVLTPPPDDDDEAEVAPSYVSNTVTTPTTSLLHRETSRFALPHSITQRTEARSLSKQKREMSLVLTPTSTRADTGATSVWVHAETDGEAFSHSSRFSAMTPVPHLASGEEADGVGVCLSTSTPPLLSARLENQNVPLNTHSADASWRDSAVCVVNALFVSLSGTSLSSSTLANVKWWLSRRSIALAVCVLVLVLGGVLASVAHFNCTYFLRGRVCHRLGQGKHVRYYTKSSTCSARGQLSGTSYHEVLSLRQLSEQMNAAYDAFDEIATWRRRYTDALTAQQQQQRQHPKQMMVEDEKEEKTVRGYEDVMRDARRRACRAQLSLTNAFSSRELGWTASHSSTTNTHTPASSSAAESKKTKSKVKDVNKARGDVPTPANPTKAGGAMAGGVKTNISHSNLSNSSRTQAAPRLPASRRHALALEARVAALLESRQRLWNLNTPSNLFSTNSKSHNNNEKNSSDLHARLSHTPWLTRSPRIRFASFTNMISPTGCTLVASAALSGFHQTLIGYEKAYGHVDRHIRQIEWIAQEGLNDDDVVVLTDSDVAWTGADVAPFLAKFIALSAESEAELDVAKVRAWEDYGEALAPLVMAGLRPSELFLRTRSSCSSAEHESSSDADTRDNTMRSRRTGKTDADVNKDDNDDDERDKNGNKREEAITPCDTARHNWGRLVQMPPILFNAEASCQRSHATKDEASCQSEADVLEIMIATRRNQPKSFDDDLLPFLQPWSRDDEEDQSVELTRASADFLARAVPVLRGAFYGTDVETWRMASAANTSATTTTTQNTRKTAEAAAGATRDLHPLSFDISPAAKRAALALRRAFPLATDAENGVDVSETATSVCVPVPPRFWGVAQAKERDEKDEELPDQTKEGNAHEPRRLSVFRFLDGATRLDPDATPLAGHGFRHCEQYEQQQQFDEEKQEKSSPDSLHEAVSFWPSRHVKKDADVAAVGEASALPHTDRDVPPTHASSSASSANTTEEAETKEREDISLVKAAMSSTPDSSGLSSEICADEESCGAERGDETESELLLLPLLTSSPTMPGRTREALHHADLNETHRTQEQETEKEESADHAKGKMTTPAAPFYNLSDLLSAMTYNTTSSPSAHSRVSTTAPFKQLSSYSDTSDAAMASASSPTTPTPSTTTATTASEAHTTLEPMPSPPLTSGDATSSRAPLSSSERTPADADYYFANLGGALNPTRHLNAGGLVARVWAYKCLVRGMLRYTREHFPADVSDKEEEGEEGEGGEVRESELAAWIHTYGGRSVPLSAIAQRALYGEPKSNEYLTRRGAGISEVKSNAEKTAATTKDAKATDSVNVSSKKQKKKKSQPKRSEKDRAQPDSTAPVSPSASSSCRADERGWYNDQAIIASMYVYGRIWEIEEDLLLAPHTSSSASTRREMREKNMANAHDLRPRRQDPYGLPPGLIGIDRASEFFFVTAMSKRGEDYVITTELPAQPEHKKKKSTNGNEPQPKKHTTTTTSSPSPRLTTATVAQPLVWETMTLSDSNVCGSSRFLLRLQCYVMRFLTAPLALVWHTDASAAAEYPQRLFRTETSESAVAVVDAMRRAGTNAALSAVDAQGKNWVCPLYLLSHAGHSENAQDGNSASSQLPSTTWTSLHARRKNALALSRPFVPTSAATATTTLREKDEPIQGSLFRDLLTRTLFPFRSAQDDSLYTPVLTPHGIACERLNGAGKTAVTLSGAVHDTDVRGHDGDEPVRCDEKGSKSETCRKKESQNRHHHQQQQQQQHAAELPRTQPGTTPTTHSSLAAATKSVFRTLWRATDTTTTTTTKTVSARTEQAGSTTTTTTAITQDQPRSVAYVSYPLLARRTTAQDALRDGRWSTLHTALQVSAAYRDLRRMLLTSRPENAMTSSSADAATPAHRATDKKDKANKHTNGASEGHGEATREEERLFPSLPLTVSDAVYMQTFQHARHEGTNASRFYMFPDDEAHTRAFFSRENRCFMNLVADRWFLSHTEGVSRPETTPNTDQDARTRDFTSQLTSCLANLAPLYAAQHTSSTTRNSVNVSPEWRRALQTYCVLPVPPLSLPLNGREPVKQTATTTSTSSSSSSASLHARGSIIDEMTREIEAEALARDALYRDHAISVSHFPRLIHFAGDWKDIRYREHRHGFSWFVTGRYDARARAANEAVLDSLEMEWIDDDTAHLFAFTELCGSPYSLI